MSTYEQRNEAAMAGLASIGLAKAKANQMDKLAPPLVAEARATGSTWTEIGRALGITKQGARQRYSTKN